MLWGSEDSKGTMDVSYLQVQSVHSGESGEKFHAIDYLMFFLPSTWWSCGLFCKYFMSVNVLGLMFGVVWRLFCDVLEVVRG